MFNETKPSLWGNMLSLLMGYCVVLGVPLLSNCSTTDGTFNANQIASKYQNPKIPLVDSYETLSAGRFDVYDSMIQ